VSNEQKLLFQTDLKRFWEIVMNDNAEARVAALGSLDDCLLCEVVRYGVLNKTEMIGPLANFYRGPVMQMSEDRRYSVYGHVAGFVEHTSIVSMNAFLPFIAEDDSRAIVSRAVIDYVSLGLLTDNDPMSRVKDIIGMIERSWLAEAELRLRSKLVSDTEAEGMLDGHAVCTSSADPDSIIIAVRMGLFRSQDQGNTWQDMRVDRFSPFTYGRDVKVSPQDPNTLYACLSVAASSKDGALYRSQDIGKTWQRFDKVTPHGTLMSVGLHHGDAKQVYVAARYGEVFGTQDGGESWLEMPLPQGVQHIYALACG
jgi:hypothetical protein